jgi:hypothetical protein
LAKNGHCRAAAVLRRAAMSACDPKRTWGLCASISYGEARHLFVD